MKGNRGFKWIGWMFLFLGGLLFIAPLWLVLMNSFKSLNDILTSPLSIPTKLQFSNYVQAWNLLHIPVVLRNTVLVTCGAVCGIGILASMAAYWSERHPTLCSRVFGQLNVVSMLIPFATIMLPIIQVMKFIHLNNTIAGAVIVYWGIGLALAYFLLRGAVRLLPRELEEAAQMDGCGKVYLFFRIVLPLLMPTVLGVVVMDMFWVWNDFMIPLVLLNNNELMTIQLAINRLFGMYNSRWDVAMPALTMSMLPILIGFIFLQKKMMSGVMSGALKG